MMRVKFEEHLYSHQSKFNTKNFVKVYVKNFEKPVALGFVKLLQEHLIMGTSTGSRNVQNVM